MKKRLIALSILSAAALLSFGCGTGKAEHPEKVAAASQVDSVLKTAQTVEDKPQAAPQAKAAPVKVKAEKTTRPAAAKPAQRVTDPREAAKRYLAHRKMWQAPDDDMMLVYYGMFDVDRDGSPELFVKYRDQGMDDFAPRIFHLTANGEPDEIVNPRKPDHCPDVFGYEAAVYEEPAISGYEYVGRVYNHQAKEVRLVAVEVSPNGLDWNLLGIHSYDVSREDGGNSSGKKWTDWKGNPITEADFNNLESHTTYGKNKKRAVRFKWQAASGAQGYGPWSMLSDKEKEDFLTASALYFEDAWNGTLRDEPNRNESGL